MVPARVDAVAAIACERIVLLVEAKSIDLVAISRLLHCVLLAVALEAETLLVVKACHLGVVKLYGAAALNRANAESFAIREAHQRASGEFQRRIKQVMRVVSIFSESLFEVPHMDQSVLMRRHEQRPSAGGVVTWHSDVNALLTNQLLRTLPSPELDLSVPATRDHDAHIVLRRYQKTEHIFHRSIVLAYRGYLVRLEAPAQDPIVSTGQQQGWRVNLPVHPQDWRLHIG